MIQFFGEQSQAVYAVKSASSLNKKTQDKLIWLFDNSPFIKEKSISGNYIGPRANMLTPWSTNAVEILQNMGVNHVLRIEKYFVINKGLNFDPMLQEKFTKFI
jgi:phosphoribosylformylglycinamidine synthase